MDQLPIKILNLILKDLSLSDQIKIRSTCRQWKELIDLILSEQEEIILFIEKSPHFSFYWNFDKKMINLENSLLVTSEIFMNQEFKKFFYNIKKLYIVSRRVAYKYEENGIFLNCFVNCFQNLKHLQINFPSWASGILKLSFHLKNLHTLYIENNREIGLLNCPNLVEFSTSSPLIFTKLESFTSKLKFLSCQSLEYEEDFNRFESLETLVLQYCEKIDLNDFQCLKKIFFLNLKSIEDFFKLILKQKKQLGRGDLEIFLCSMKYSEDLIPLCKYLKKRTNFKENWLIKSIKQEDPTFDFLYRLNFYPTLFDIDYEFLQIYINNRNKFRSDSTKRSAIYSDSMGIKLYALKKLDSEMFEDFSKFFDQLTIDNIIKNDLLLSVKDAFKYVNLVYLNKSDQSLLDLLPIAFPNLSEVYIDPLVLKRNKFINFKFLIYLKNLQEIYGLNKNTYSLEDLNEIFEHCKFLNCVDFFDFTVFTYRNSEGIKEFGLADWNRPVLNILFFHRCDNRSFFRKMKSHIIFDPKIGTPKIDLLKYLEGKNLLYHDKSVQIV